MSLIDAPLADQITLEIKIIKLLLFLPGRLSQIKILHSLINLGHFKQTKNKTIITAKYYHLSLSLSSTSLIYLPLLDEYSRNN